MVPFISEVVQSEQDANLQTSNIAQFELLILKILDWRLHCTTHLHFLDWHKRTGVIAAADAIDSLPIMEKARVKLMKYIYFFADMLLLDFDFCEYSQTLSSAAIIATARLTQHIEPIWPQHLANKTGFAANDIACCVNHMVHAFCRDWPDAAPDHLRNPDGSPRTITITVSARGQASADANESSSMVQDFTQDGQDDVMIEDGERMAHSTRCAPLEEGDSVMSSAATEVGDNSHVGS